MNYARQIMQYEQGLLEEADVIELFSNLINSGMINHLQGHYGRTAQALIDQGLIFFDD